MNKVSVIVLNYNNLDFLKKCIKSLETQSYRDTEVVIVDNNSTDGSVGYIKAKESEKIKVVLNKKNYGYARGNNIGTENSTGELLFILNNDTELFNDTIEQLVHAYEKKTILIPQQLIERDNNIIKVNGNGADIFGYPFGYKRLPENKLFYADGAAVFISKQDFNNLGKFDEEMFMFQEDIDLSWRAHLYGYKLKLVPNSKLRHFSGATAVGGRANTDYKLTYFRRYFNERNVIFNMIKNYGSIALALLLPILLLVHLLEMVIFLIKGEIKGIGCYVRAYKWIIFNFKMILKKRKQVQEKRLRSDLFIIRKMTPMYSKLMATIRQKNIPDFS